MPAVCFYFQVHQPWRVKRFTLFDVGGNEKYFNDQSGTNLDNAWILKKVAKYCYTPTNQLLLHLLNQHPEFKIAFSLSGTFLDQLEMHFPELRDSFKALAATGQVEFLAETYYHSLAFIYSSEEFERQVILHQEKIKDLFGQKPTVFRNTELIYNNDVALAAEKLGFQAAMAEGVDDILDWRSANFVYEPPHTQNLRILMKNYKLSDDIAFRFSQRSWKEWPLTVDKFASWVSAINGTGDVINLFMDYETFGEHQPEGSGIFHFLERLPAEVLENPDNSFVTPSEAIKKFPVRDTVDVPRITSWADMERDLTAWTGNEMQKTSLAEVYAQEKEILASNDQSLINDWRNLLTSDHFYYMCTKWFSDGDVHAYFSPYESPYDAFTSYMNALEDLKLRLEQCKENNKIRYTDEKETSYKKQEHKQISILNHKIPQVI